MGTTDKYCLRWNDYRSNISVAFQDLRSSADFFDVTLATEEAEIQAHRVILSACSPHLREVLKRHSGANHQNILIYLRGVRQCDLEAILEFMYNGEVNVAQEDLNSFLAVAEDLKVKGLTQNASGQSPNHSSETQSMQPHPLVKIKSSPPPPIVNRNGGGPPVKRMKRDSSVLQVKEESGSNQQVVVTPDVGYDGANSSETMKVDDPVYEVEDEGEVYPYGAYGSDSGEIGDSLIDPATMAVPGTSGMDGNKDFLDSPLVRSWVGRGPDGRRMCKLCGLTGGDVTRIKNHIESVHWPHSQGYACEQCSAVCKTRHALACHKSRHHPKNKQQPQTPKGIPMPLAKTIQMPVAKTIQMPAAKTIPSPVPKPNSPPVELPTSPVPNEPSTPAPAPMARRAPRLQAGRKTPKKS